MAVGFQIDMIVYLVGSGDFLNSFFSTVCYRLEAGRLGSRYPYLMRKLYPGHLPFQEVRFAKAELMNVQAALKNFPPSQVIWDMDDLKKQPPWGARISKRITDLSNYFVTSDGRDLISVMFMAFEESEREKIDIRIVSL